MGNLCELLDPFTNRISSKEPPIRSLSDKQVVPGSSATGKSVAQRPVGRVNF